MTFLKFLTNPFKSFTQKAIVQGSLNLSPNMVMFLKRIADEHDKENATPAKGMFITIFKNKKFREYSKELGLSEEEINEYLCEILDKKRPKGKCITTKTKIFSFRIRQFIFNFVKEEMGGGYLKKGFKKIFSEEWGEDEWECLIKE